MAVVLDTVTHFDAVSESGMLSIRSSNAAHAVRRDQVSFRTFFQTGSSALTGIHAQLDATSAESGF